MMDSVDVLGDHIYQKLEDAITARQKARAAYVSAECVVRAHGLAMRSVVESNGGEWVAKDGTRVFVDKAFGELAIDTSKRLPIDGEGK